MSNPRKRIADRLDAAGVNTERFVQCKPGEKASVDHTRYHHDEVADEYGIYALASDGLVIIDIDDYEGINDKSGLKALAELEPTLEQSSPHGGTHRLYVIEPTEEGTLVAKVLEDTFGTKNPNPSWGEVRVANQYVVGAGSQLDGCDKSWCDDCETEDGGGYELNADREIATHTAGELVAVLKEDPDLDVETEDGEVADETVDVPDVDADTNDLLEYALECDDKLDRLWRGNYSDYGGDRSESESALAMKLGWWFQQDKQKVRRLMDRASTQKWAEREDDSYRDSVLAAVDELDSDDMYDPSEHGHDDPSDFDPKEVERGVALLESQTSPQSPPRELIHKNGCYGYEKAYKDDNGEVANVVFDTVCNFTLETLSFLETDDGEQIRLRVHPQNPREDHYDIRINPTVFNDTPTFKEEVVCGRTTWFDTSNRKGVPAQTILSHLRELVGSQPAPIRTGTEFIGLSEDRSEWVTPVGSLTADGWTDDPAYEFYSKGGDDDSSGAMAEVWQLEPDDGADYDSEEVRRICELLPKVRKLDRGLPMLGWFYAAPLKPYIHDEFGEGEFNILQIYADSGAGKTTSLQALWEAFGADANPFDAADTSFTVEKHLTESCGLPVWYDEFKPAEMPEHRLKRLRRTLKGLTKERLMTKGTANLGEVTFRFRAPAVMSGEQKFQDPPVRRRSIMTNLTQEATNAGSDTAQAFGQLTGSSYEDSDGNEHYPEGCDLSQHALAYYQYILGLNEEQLEAKWQSARSDVADMLGTLGVSVEQTELQGLQTVVYGVNLYREFAKQHGVAKEDLPTDRDILDAVAHVVENIGKDGSRREHADDYMELLTLAATEGYIEPGIHYRVLHSTNHGKDVLAVHMPSAFNAVKKFIREYNIEDEYTVLQKDDYSTSFGNKAGQDGTYVLDTNKRTRGIGNGARAIHFDPDRAEEKLGGDFQLGAFTDIDDDETEDSSGDGDDPDGTPLGSLKPGYRDVTATVASTVEPKPWLEAEGTLKDESGITDYVARGDTNPVANIDEGDRIHITDARVERDEDGVIRLELRDGITEVSLIESTQSGLDSHGDAGETETAADGGVAGLTQEERKKEIKKRVTQLQNASDSAGASRDDVIQAVVGEGADPEKVEEDLEKFLEKGEIYEPQSDNLRIS